MTLGLENHVGRFRWAKIQKRIGDTGWIQGTGYTGEAGYEIFIPNSMHQNCGVVLLMRVQHQSD